jgi:exodeoxyribonuclease VII large subunit
MILQKINTKNQQVEMASKCLKSGFTVALKTISTNLENLEKNLKSNHYREILKRGFAVVKNQKGDLISSVVEMRLEEEILVEMSDGEVSLNPNFKS